jgi:hypothetical protein
MRNAVLLILFALLSGCATFVETRVSAFHELVQPLTGATYALVPYKDQEGSLEYQSYAKLIAAELAKQGMSETSLDNATFAIFMLYGIDDGRQIVSSYPIFGQTGTSGSQTFGTVTSYGNTATYSGTTYRTPTYGVVGSGTRTDTVFKRYLNIDIIDIEKSGKGNVQKVYEGKATSSGQTGDLSTVMPSIVKSIFEDFPGKSGASRTSRQPIDE